MKTTICIGYLLILSLVGFWMMGVDKSRAKREAWRIPEKSIFLVAVLGGSLGTVLGMHLFHHKTRHWYFKYGLPVILLLQVVLLLYLNNRLPPW